MTVRHAILWHGSGVLDSNLYGKNRREVRNVEKQVSS